MAQQNIFSSANSSTSFVQRTPTNSSGDQKGTLVPLTISYAGSTINLLVSERDSFELEKLRDEFEEEELALDEDSDAPLSTPERLCLRFVSSVMQCASQQSAVESALSAFEDRFLKSNDIHTIAGQTPATMNEEKEFLKSYYAICDYCDRRPKAAPSALLEAAESGEARIYAAFGGQGAVNPICLQEIKELHRIYEPLLADLLEELSPLLEDLSTSSEVESIFESHPLRVSQWIEGTATPPDSDDLATAPYSFPLVGLLGLCHYVISCKASGLTPGQMRSSLKGVTGHSQGIAVAAAVSLAETWDQFYAASKTVMEMLFWLGYYSQKSSPKSPLSAKLITDSVDNGEGEPANLLSVRGLQRKQIDSLVATVNKSLDDNEKVYVALRNTSSNFVLAGPAHSLHGVNKNLRAMKAGDGEVQSRIAYDKRKPVVYHSFLPVSAPFHTPYLKAAAESVKLAMSGTVIKPSALAIPVFETHEAVDLRQSSYDNILHKLVDNICIEYADWLAVLKCPEATHIVSFDAGGIGNTIVQIKDGLGVRTIFGSDFGRSDDRVGRKTDLLSTSFAALSAQPQSWLERFAPKIERSATGEYKISTKLTKLLGMPYVTVAAMTPTTVPWDMCAAVMNAGYHIELAGGGYYNDAGMTAAVKSLVGAIPAGRGITCNIIYSSPHAVQWQIPMLRRLVREGYPIDGLSIGAGVPSSEVTEEYISTLGLRHITLKPGSHSAIRDTIAIAAAHPSFPVILQWTGGRGGGHHSYEDFHDPVLDLYSEIRKYDNLILVAGSGFGGAEDTYPYLTGTWSTDLYGRAAMPFDGIMFGSRMMVAKEAHTSPQAKALICACPGTEINEWTDSYNKPVGGIITVKSEMGQPIHKVATRGVLFWAEMDKTFALPAEKRSKEIQSKKSYIIRRLNADFAKPYFGRNAAGLPVDVAEMTYAEVISRMIDLMYVRHQSRWINKTYETFVCNMVQRTIERLGGDRKAAVASISDPLVFYKTLVDCVPAITTTILDPDDESYFLNHCKKRGQKPVNFVPVIDDGLETWMKKDSLWQSEDVDAVIDQDVQRVCILQGPVAARFSTNADQSAKEILDEISSKHIEFMMRDHAETVEEDSDGETLGQSSPAIQAFCSEEFVLRGSSRVTNPLRRILQLPTASSTFIDGGKKLIISVSNGIGREDDTVEVETADDKNITVRLIYVKPSSTDGATLEMTYLWHAERPFYQIEEFAEKKNSRIRDFYRKLWLQDLKDLSGAKNYFEASQITLTPAMADKITKAVKLADAAHLKSSMPTDLFPLDGLIMVSWNIVVKPLLIDTLDGDLLNLVHLSNKAEYLHGAEPFRIGDTISGSSQISSLSIGKAGKTLEVRAELSKDGKPVAAVTSAFLFRGSYQDFHQTFRDVNEPERELAITNKMDEAILKDRSWFKLDSAATSLVGKTLAFRLKTSCTWEDSDTFGNLISKGAVFEKTAEEKLVKIGQVSFEASRCHGNPVVDFLTRKGELTEKIHKLKQPGWDGDSFYEVQVPATNEAYSMVSYDCNPIHTAPAFAAWADLPGTITHGMYTSAIVRGMLESIIANGDRKRFRSFSSRFTGMVLPKDVLHVKLSHVAMREGSKVFDIKVVKEDTGDQVLDGEAIVEEVSTTFIFTGQGSQSKGMGMDLYESSPVAKKLWDDTDRYLLNTYGWSILQVVRENPKSLTVYFGGKRGREIRKNYLALTIQNIRPDGTVTSEPILKSLTPSSMSYTFTEPRGLLFSTQFAQPAITLVSKAAFLDLKSKGLVPPESTFAGHSLGEYGALSAFTDFIPFHTLMSVVFYRGLTMQVAMDRDEHGSTDFSMVAVNPGRIGKWFDEGSLRQVLSAIATKTDGLMEIVNFNVKGEQYVAAGHLRNIYTLGGVMDCLFGNPDASAQVKEYVSLPAEQRDSTTLGKVIVREIAKAQALKKPFELKRGKATIPLQGIDVPFHSTYLRPSVPAYRAYLEQKLRVEDIVPERLINKFIPNVMAKPFTLESDYFTEAADLTGSNILRRVAETGFVGA